jgi:UDP-glucose 4-epimerase
MAEILVTGGNGFIGSRIAYFLSDKHKVKVLDLNKNPAFDSIACDITDKKWIDLIGKADFVFHFASVGGNYKLNSPVQLIHVELSGLYNVMNYALKYNIKKVIYPSTTLLTEKFKEKFSFSKIYSNPYFSYVAAKLLGEYYLQEFCKENNLGYSIVRYYNVYGENQKAVMAVPYFVRSAIEGKPLIVFGSGKQERDFTYVDDVAKATILVAFSEETYSKAVNIGTGKKTSILELAKLIKKLTKSKSEILFDNFPPGLNELESERIDFSSQALNELAGFECKTSLKEGLKKVIASIQERKQR